MARTILTKKLAQIRDIDYVRALLKTSAMQPPAAGLPNQLPGLPGLPKPLVPQQPLVTRPAPRPPLQDPTGAPAATAATPLGPPPALSRQPANPPAAPSPVPSPMGPPPPLSRQPIVAPDVSNTPPVPVTQGEASALPPAQATTPVNPQPQPMSPAPQPPTTAISPQGQQPPESDTPAPAPPTDTPTVTRTPDATSPPTQSQPAPLARQQAVKPTETDGTVFNKQLADATAGWQKKLKDGGPDAVPVVAREMVPLLEKTLNKDILAQHSGALADLRAGKVNTPAIARLMQEQVGPAGEKFMTDAIARSGATDPYGFGAAANKAGDMWKSLGDYGQIAFALGVPMTLIGMMGNSGMASVLGMLGLGAAGGFATLNGAFGEEPAKMVEGLLGGAAKGMGINTPSREQYEKRIRDASRISQAAGEAEQEKIHGELKNWSFLPSGRAGAAELGATPEERKQRLYDRAHAKMKGAIQPALNAYNSAVPDAVQALPSLARLGLAHLPESMRTAIQPYQERINSGINSADAVLNPTGDNSAGTAMRIYGWKNPAAQQNTVPGREVRAYAKAAAVVDIALGRESVVAIALGRKKSARCWAGYEPVPGAKAYSEGSCRPKGSKKTKKEVISGKKHTEKK